MVILGGVAFLFSEPGKALRDIWKTGAVQGMISDEEKLQYNPTSEGNLVAIRTALMLHHDSEGAFPAADKWMDSIENRLLTSNMTKEEAGKKLIRPDLESKPSSFGYSLNDKVAGKYKDDVPPKTVLVYESKATARNAHGDAEAKGQRVGLAITVDGTILKK